MEMIAYFEVYYQFRAVCVSCGPTRTFGSGLLRNTENCEGAPDAPVKARVLSDSATPMMSSALEEDRACMRYSKTYTSDWCWAL